MTACLEPEPWTAKAACAGRPELFFPEKGGSERRAKLICQSCPVRLECLLSALEHHEPCGVWGQKNPDERTAIRRGAPIQWKRIKCNHGHDVADVGVTERGLCRACQTVRNHDEWLRRKAAKQ